MFLPKGYFDFNTAFVVAGGLDKDGGGIGRIGGALASGELVSQGIVAGYLRYDAEEPGLGSIVTLRPETWRRPGTREAVTGLNAEMRLYQDELSIVPIIEEAALLAWDKADREGHQPVQVASSGTTDGSRGLSFGVHPVPAGYVTFDRIPSLARAWAKEGTIDPGLMVLLDPPDTDSMTMALANGSLRAFGVSRRTGEILTLPPSVWRMDLDGVSQSFWAVGGNDVMSGPDGETCLPIISRADLARCLEATEIPPDPEELPEGWQKATRLPISMIIPGDGIMALDSWMNGLARAYKIRGTVVKRDDAIKAATTYLGCSTRQAEAAYEALPYPELRNAPRTSQVRES